MLQGALTSPKRPGCTLMGITLSHRLVSLRQDPLHETHAAVSCTPARRTGCKGLRPQEPSGAERPDPHPGHQPSHILGAFSHTHTSSPRTLPRFRRGLRVRGEWCLMPVSGFRTQQLTDTVLISARPSSLILASTCSLLALYHGGIRANGPSSGMSSFTT